VYKNHIKNKTSEDQIAGIERKIGIILRIGVGLSIALILLGVVLFSFGSNYSERVLLIGIGVLIITPIIRILACVFSFGRERDWLYLGITILVLVVIAVSMAIGFVL
jgi:uncharacterized membrane protein